MACQCMCSQACENLSQMLSSEPDTFPIEDAIAPLVFELKRTGLFTPCWSCEGHLNPAGQLWKLPQVWFYCSSTVHLRVLSDLLKSLELKKLLNTRWTVSVTHSDVDNLDTTFAVYPELPERAAPTLVSLQADARAIARAMQHDFAAAARKLKAGVGA
jgi:hypothetical protein